MCNRATKANNVGSYYLVDSSPFTYKFSVFTKIYVHKELEFLFQFELFQVLEFFFEFLEFFALFELFEVFELFLLFVVGSSIIQMI